jgi:hypothetical protein
MKIPVHTVVFLKTSLFEILRRADWYLLATVAYPGIFLGGGVQQIHLRTEDRENGDLGAVAP